MSALHLWKNGLGCCYEKIALKIVFLTSSLGAGGAERVATSLANAWAERGDEVTLVPTFSGGGSPFYKLSEGVQLAYLADLVRRSDRSLIGYFERFWGLRTLISRMDPDVVISFLPNVNVAAIFATLALRAPLIICERRDPFSQPCSQFWELACRLSYRFADMLTVQTPSLVPAIANLYPNVRRVRAVPNPLPERIVTIRKGQHERKRKVLLSLGRLSQEKQVQKAVAAFSWLAPSFQNWDFHIYGEGQCEEAIRNQIDGLGIGDRIFLRGRTNEPWQIMANADAFLMTSRYEGFPNALLEAMGVGLPCIVLDCPSGPREITRNGADALLVSLDDEAALVRALEEVMSDEALRTKLGDGARDSVLARYRLQTVLETWDQLFREVGVSN